MKSSTFSGTDEDLRKAFYSAFKGDELFICDEKNPESERFQGRRYVLNKDNVIIRFMSSMKIVVDTVGVPVNTVIKEWALRVSRPYYTLFMYMDKNRVGTQVHIRLDKRHWTVYHERMKKLGYGNFVLVEAEKTAFLSCLKME